MASWELIGNAVLMAIALVLLILAGMVWHAGRRDD